MEVSKVTRSRQSFALSLIVFTGLTSIALAQQGSSSANVKLASRSKPKSPSDLPYDGQAHLRVDSNTVMIPAQVTRMNGSPALDLQKQNFRVFEDGVEQQLTHFASEDAPVSIGILLDASGSMKDKSAKATEAAARFFQTANRDDEFFLIEFGDRARLSIPFTTDPDQVYQRISRAHPFGRTSLYDAVHLALQHMKNARYSRKALLILSDGGDNSSRHNFLSIKTDLFESDVQVYAMGISTPETPSEPDEERRGPELLAQLAESTGGWHFPVVNINDLPEISARIGEQLRSQYVLGYSPNIAVRDGKYRKVTLQVIPPDGAPKYRVAYRHGYTIPID